MCDGGCLDPGVGERRAGRCGGEGRGEACVQIVAGAGRGGEEQPVGAEEGAGRRALGHVGERRQLIDDGVSALDGRRVEHGLDAAPGQPVHPVLGGEQRADVLLLDAGRGNRRADRDDAGRHGAT